MLCDRLIRKGADFATVICHLRKGRDCRRAVGPAPAKRGGPRMRWSKQDVGNVARHEGGDARREEVLLPPVSRRKPSPVQVRS